MKYLIIMMLLLAGCGTDGKNGSTGATGPQGPAGATGANGSDGSNAYTSIAAYTIGSNTTCIPTSTGSTKRTSNTAKKVYIYTTANCTGTKVTLTAGNVYYNASTFFTFDNTKFTIYKF